jgi:hypothetical protein
LQLSRDGAPCFAERTSVALRCLASDHTAQRTTLFGKQVDPGVVVSPSVYEVLLDEGAVSIKHVEWHHSVIE